MRSLAVKPGDVIRMTVEGRVILRNDRPVVLTPGGTQLVLLEEAIVEKLVDREGDRQLAARDAAYNVLRTHHLPVSELAQSALAGELGMAVLHAVDHLVRVPVVEVELPANWFVRDGEYESGRAFTYCPAEGPEQAHCVNVEGHVSDHSWAWFTRAQRARAEGTVDGIRPHRDMTPREAEMAKNAAALSPPGGLRW